METVQKSCTQFSEWGIMHKNVEVNNKFFFKNPFNWNYTKNQICQVPDRIIPNFSVKKLIPKKYIFPKNVKP